MSEDGKKKDKKDVPEDKSTPDVLDENFVRWAERCFRGDEQANFFMVHQIFGRDGKVEGESLGKWPVSHLKGDGGANHEHLVAVCNEIVEAMQDEANQMRRPRRFAVTAYNSLKGGAFARKTIEREPQRGLVKLGQRSSDNDGDDENDPLGGDILRKRADTVLADGRYYAELVAQVLGGNLQLVIEQNKDKDRMIKELFDANMALARQANEAENNKLDRDLIRAERELILSAKRKGVSLLAGLLPDFLRKVTNGAVNVPGGRTPESLVVEAMFDEKNGGLTSEEKHHIVGDWTDQGERLTPGILGEKQVRILVGILNEKSPVTDLDKLISDGSEEQLTQDQYMKIMQVLKGDMDKLLPFVNILKERKAALDKKKLAEGPPEVRTEN